MDDDLFGNPSQQLGPSTSTGPSLGISSIGKPSPLGHSSMLGGNTSLFGQTTTDTSLGGFGTVPPMMRTDLSPPLGGFSSLAPSTNNFMLNPFDNDDYSNHCKCLMAAPEFITYVFSIVINRSTRPDSTSSSRSLRLQSIDLHD